MAHDIVYELNGWKNKVIMKEAERYLDGQVTMNGRNDLKEDADIVEETLKAINMARQEERNNARIEERAKAIKSFCKIKCGESKECNQYCYDCIEFIKLINE